LVPTIVTPMFGTENYHVVDGIARQNPHAVNGQQVEVVYDDGRHFLRTAQEKFDMITSDPVGPWVKGCAALNTVEYYQMCRDHLNPGGSVCLWFPINEGDLETTKSVINTDRNLRLQYLAGMWLNSNMGERILSSNLAYDRFPDQTFVGSPEAIDALKQALDQEGRNASAGLGRTPTGS